MAGVLEWSWPIPFVVPPCLRPAFLRTRHKVPRCSGTAWPRLHPASPDRCCSESYARFSPPTALGGYRPWGCQVAGKRPPIGANRKESLRQYGRRRARQPSPWGTQSAQKRARSGAGAALNRAIGTIGVDVERTGRSLDHFARDHDLFDAFQARKIEHGLKQDAFENRAQAARAGLAIDR